jgi:hypothetical protein
MAKKTDTPWEENICVTCGVRFGVHDPSRWGYCMGQSMLMLIDKHLVSDSSAAVAEELRTQVHERMWEGELDG